MSIPQLMHLKLYLNKYLKVDNIEYYSMNCLFRLREEYDHYLDMTGGFDPDFPEVNVGGKDRGQKIKGTNKIQAEEREKMGLSYNDGTDILPEDTVNYDDSASDYEGGSREILNLHK